jgi:hypothetical protein
MIGDMVARIGSQCGCKDIADQRTFGEIRPFGDRPKSPAFVPAGSGAIGRHRTAADFRVLVEAMASGQSISPV